MDDVFSDRLVAWQDYQKSPWARIRYAVTGEVLRRQVEQLGGPVRVLDVGGGDGADSVPLAAAGHEVTIVDPSESWLREAHDRAESAGTTLSTIVGGLDDLPSGEWDLVLCHFVLRYRATGVDDLAALARCVRLGGRLSVMDVNPDGRVLRSLVTDGPRPALAELRADRVDVQLFDTDARKVSWAEVGQQARSAALHEVGLFGIRIANDLLVDDAAKTDETFFADLLALELELCDRAPFNRVGFAWQAIFQR